MANMTYMFLFNLAFVVIILAERSHYGGLKVEKVKDSIDPCEEYIWDEKTLLKRSEHGLSVGIPGKIIEDNFLECLTDLRFEVFDAKQFQPDKSCLLGKREVKDPKDCKAPNPVSLVVQRSARGFHTLKKSSSSRLLLRTASQQKFEIPGMEPGHIPAAFEKFLDEELDDRHDTMECQEYVQDLQHCFHGAQQGDEPLEYDGDDIYNTSVIFVKW